MKKYLIVAFLIFTVLQAKAYDWGKTGHRTTGEIAEKYLTKKAKRALDKLLGGESLALISTYADEIKSDTLYRPYGPWHYVNIPFGKTYDTHPKNERGDIIMGIESCITQIKNPRSTKTERIFNLKLLVHLIGDLHQPLHTGLQEDKGGNDFQVRWFNEGTNLHAVWDTKMIESYNMSYSELAKSMPELTKNQVKSIEKGGALDWMEESRSITMEVYKTTSKGGKLGYRYMYDYFGTVRDQLQKGGIRLAKVLNELFG